MRLSYFQKLICCCVLALTTIAGNAAASETLASCKDSSIVITPIGDQGGDGHGVRLPAQIPISASYEAMLSTVFLTFSHNLGEIEVEVMNTTTGGYDSGTTDTQYLYATVPITMGPGHYIILFTLPSGQRYKGELDNYSNLFTCVMQGF